MQTKNTQSKWPMVRIRKDLYDYIAAQGEYGESFSDIIVRIFKITLKKKEAKSAKKENDRN